MRGEKASGGHGEAKVLEEIEKKFSKDKILEVDSEKVMTEEEEIEDQYREIMRYLERELADFITNENNGSSLTREQSTRIFHELQVVLRRIDFYRKDFLVRYFGEHDEAKLFKTGKTFSFKSDGSLASFDLFVTRKCKFELRAQPKDTPAGDLAQKIQDADDSGKMAT